MALVTLYTKPGCHLCEAALKALLQIQAELPFELAVQDIAADDALLWAYFERIPVVSFDDEVLFEYFVDPETLMERLREECSQR